MRRALVISVAFGLLAAACSDTEAPTWGSGAELRAAEPAPDAVTVEWPAASDDRGVHRYVVRVDGAEAARLDADARAHTADGFDEATEHRVEVVALDEAGNASAALEATVATADVTAPAFSPTARLTIRRVRAAGDDNGEVAAEGSAERAAPGAGAATAGDDPSPPSADAHLASAAEGAAVAETGTLRLVWSPAVDAVGVARYRVLADGEEVGAIDAPENALELRDVALGVAREYVVRAVDAAGNESPDGPSARWGIAVAEDAVDPEEPDEPGTAPVGGDLPRAEAERMLRDALSRRNPLGGSIDMRRLQSARDAPLQVPVR